jgi:hypothetical protein
MHELADYFQDRKGFGVLATADASGRVNTAVYATPHFMEDGSLAFIMQEKLTHENLLSNPYASYLFREETEGHKGRRIYLKKVREEKDTELLYSLRRRKVEGEEKKNLYLVFFEVQKVLPLLGTGE